MNRIGHIPLPDIKVCCEAIVNKNRKPEERQTTIKDKGGISETNTHNLSSTGLLFQRG